jgi:glutamine amidotransferase
MKNASVCIIDYGVGNTQSVFNALDFLGYKVRLSQDASVIEKSDVLLLPGVGAFEAARNNLDRRGLIPVLNEQVLEKKKPILGICLGMQLMAGISEENGLFEGLNWIPGKVVKIPENPSFPVPHVGWNQLEILKKSPLFLRLNNDSHFYFDHSYHFVPENPAHVAAYCNYGTPLVASLINENIMGVQFHPEKSQINGLKLFRSFVQEALQHV